MKRVFLLLFALVLLPSLALAQPFILGDVDDNGRVDVDDAWRILRNLLDEADAVPFERGDVNGDDWLSVQDLVLVLEAACGVRQMPLVNPLEGEYTAKSDSGYILYLEAVRQPDGQVLFTVKGISFAHPVDVVEILPVYVLEDGTEVRVSTISPDFMRGNTFVTTVYYPAELDELGAGAFADCTALVELIPH